MRARPATSFRAVLDRLETALAPREPALAELAREVRWRCCDAPGLAAGRERDLRGDGRPPGRAGRGRRPRRAHDARWSSARSRSRSAARPPLGRRRPAGRGDDAPLLPDPPARVGRAAAGRGRPVRADGLRARRRAPPRRGHRRRPRRPRRRAARARRVRPRRARGRAAARRRLPAARAEEDLAGARASTRSCRSRAGPRRVRARARGRRAHVRRATARSAPTCAACTRCSPSGWTSGACASSRSSACPRPRTSTCSAPRRARTRRTSGWSRSPRSATSRRCATSAAASPRCPSSSGWCARRSRRCARSSRSRPPRERLHWNRLLLYAWPSVDFQPAEAGAVINRFARMSAGLGLEMVQLRLRIGDEDRVLRMFNPAGRGVTVELGDPPTRAAAAARRGRAADHLRAPPRARAPGRDRQAARRRLRGARPRRRRARPGRPAGRHQHGEHRGRADPQPHRSPPRGHAARRAARRPDARARLAGRAGVRARDRRARPRRAARRAGRVVRGLLRRPDRDGLRDREHGLGRGGAAADRALHPGGRRDQRRRERASTSAPSRTGTPRRRCSCTPRASS